MAWLSQFSAWMRRRLSGARHHRLLAAIEACEQELLAHAPPRCGDDPIRDKVESLLGQARADWKDGVLHVAWGALQAARRLELLLLPREVLAARATALRAEADAKLTGWRRNAVLALLSHASSRPERQIDKAVSELAFALKAGGASTHCDSERPAEGASPAALVSLDELRARTALAAQLIDGQHENTYFKQEVVTSRATILLLVLVVLLGLAILLLTPAFGVLHGPIAEYGPRSFEMLPFVALMGAIGACFSGLSSVTRSIEGRIPGVVLSTWFTLIRPSIGAIGAIVVFLAQLGEIINIAQDTVAAVLTVAFISGFSDALVVRVAGFFPKSETS